MKQLSTALTLMGVCLLAVASMAAWADDVPERATFTKDILPILQENCQTCHRPLGLNLSGMVAPMSLTSYQEVRPWAKAIARVVKSGEMPPWHAAVEQNGRFRNERTLTETEIQTIVKWVDQRAPRGNPSDAPAPVEFSNSGWNFGEPDLVVEFDEPFFVKDDVQDLYENITVQLTEEQLPEDKWIRAIEFRPGSEVVHHIIGHATKAGAEGERTTRGMLGGNAPGADENRFPEGFGIQLLKGSEITFAMHYHKESGPGTGTWDSSQIGLAFHDKPVVHPIEISTVAHGAFEIPPFNKSWRVGASRSFTEDTLLLGMLPHAHLRAVYAKYTAFYPDGNSEVLLEVPQYDFNWQTGYAFNEIKVLPAGSRIEMEFRFDNSKENADRVGFNASRAIRFGGPTTDEMDLAWITIAPAEEMDATEAGD